jgi:hypothetical protein
LPCDVLKIVAPRAKEDGVRDQGLYAWQ